MTRPPESHNPQEPAKTSRREFLKSIATIGAAAALSGCGAEFLNKQTNSEEKEELEEIIDGIIVDGEPNFIAATKVALAILKGSSFETIKRHLGRIKQSSYSGMDAEAEIPTYNVGRRTWLSSTSWYASTIAHDTFHSFLYHAYEREHEGEPVERDAWTGAEVEKQCLKFQLKILKETNGDDKDIKYVKKLMDDPTYQDIDIENRDW